MMKNYFLFLNLIILVLAQDEIWVKIDKGEAFYINPKNSKWEPLALKEKISDFRKSHADVGRRLSHQNAHSRNV